MTTERGGRPRRGQVIPKVCKIDGCEKARAVGSRGWCKAHYTRWLRNGDVGPVAVQVKDPGAPCKVEGCEKIATGGTLRLCAAHYARERRKPNWERIAKIGGYEESSPYWTGEDATYDAVHFRVKTRRGPARQYPCVGPDCHRQAAQWAYTHGDPDEKSSPEGWLYSLDINRYAPMCRFCHKALDRQYRLARKESVA